MPLTYSTTSITHQQRLFSADNKMQEEQAAQTNKAIDHQNRPDSELDNLQQNSLNDNKDTEYSEHTQYSMTIVKNSATPYSKQPVGISQGHAFPTSPPMINPEFILLSVGFLMLIVRFASPFWFTSRPFAIIFCLFTYLTTLQILVEVSVISVVYKLYILTNQIPPSAKTFPKGKLPGLAIISPRFCVLLSASGFPVALSGLMAVYNFGMELFNQAVTNYANLLVTGQLDQINQSKKSTGCLSNIYEAGLDANSVDNSSLDRFPQHCSLDSGNQSIRSPAYDTGLGMINSSKLPIKNWSSTRFQYTPIVLAITTKYWHPPKTSHLQPSKILQTNQHRKVSQSRSGTPLQNGDNCFVGGVGLGSGIMGQSDRESWSHTSMGLGRRPMLGSFDRIQQTSSQLRIDDNCTHSVIVEEPLEKNILGASCMNRLPIVSQTGGGKIWPGLVSLVCLLFLFASRACLVNPVLQCYWSLDFKLAVFSTVISFLHLVIWMAIWLGLSVKSAWRFRFVHIAPVLGSSLCPVSVSTTYSTQPLGTSSGSQFYQTDHQLTGQISDAMARESVTLAQLDNFIKQSAHLQQTGAQSLLTRHPFLLSGLNNLLSGPNASLLLPFLYQNNLQNNLIATIAGLNDGCRSASANGFSGQAGSDSVYGCFTEILPPANGLTQTSLSALGQIGRAGPSTISDDSDGFGGLSNDSVKQGTGHYSHQQQLNTYAHLQSVIAAAVAATMSASSLSGSNAQQVGSEPGNGSIAQTSSGLDKFQASQNELNCYDTTGINRAATSTPQSEIGVQNELNNLSNETLGGLVQSKVNLINAGFRGRSAGLLGTDPGYATLASLGSTLGQVSAGSIETKPRLSIGENDMQIELNEGHQFCHISSSNLRNNVEEDIGENRRLEVDGSLNGKETANLAQTLSSLNYPNSAFINNATNFGRRLNSPRVKFRDPRISGLGTATEMGVGLMPSVSTYMTTAINGHNRIVSVGEIGRDMANDNGVMNGLLNEVVNGSSDSGLCTNNTNGSGSSGGRSGTGLARLPYDDRHRSVYSRDLGLDETIEQTNYRPQIEYRKLTRGYNGEESKTQIDAEPSKFYVNQQPMLIDGDLEPNAPRAGRGALEMSIELTSRGAKNRSAERESSIDRNGSLQRQKSKRQINGTLSRANQKRKDTEVPQIDQLCSQV